MKKFLAAAVAWLWLSGAAFAGVTCSLPFNLQNGTIADASQVMANYNALVTCLSNAAAAGNNDDITALLDLTTPLAPASGGSTDFIGGTSTSATNAYTIATTVPSTYVLTANYRVIFIANATNTGAATLTVAGTATTNFYRQTPAGPQAMVGGEVVANQIVIAAYDGTQYECLNCVSQALVPVGGEIDFTGPVGNIPSGWVLADGRALNRTTFANLFNTYNYTVSATMNGTTTVAVTGAGNFVQSGWFVGGTNLSCNAVVQSVSTNSFVINTAATGSGTNNITVGPYPQGDCSTTFSIADHIGKVTAGVDGSVNITSATCTNPASVGDKQTGGQPCGTQTQTLTAAQVPSITSNVTVTSPTSNYLTAPSTGFGITSFSANAGSQVWQAFSQGASIVVVSSITSTGTATSNNTSGSAHPILQPTALTYKIIKY